MLASRTLDTTVAGATLSRKHEPEACSEAPHTLPVTQQRKACSMAAALPAIKQWCIDNFMIISFSVALVVAMTAPSPGKAVGALQVGDIKIIQAINNIMVFLVSGLTLKSDDLRALMRQWPGWLYGIASILFISPCLGFAMVRLPLNPAEFSTGLAIFCVVPTTLGVGVALTAASKGNQALALFLTVVTNLLGIVTVPYGLRLILSGTGTVTVEPQSLVVKLLITVLVPTVAGKLAREFIPGVRNFVTEFKTQLSMFSTVNLAMIIWQTLSGSQSILIRLPFTNVLIVIAVAVALHVVLLIFNAIVVKYILRLPVREAIAVFIMSSQKSAPVAVTVITYITPDIAQQGLLAIPCIVGQLAQIFIGSGLARYLRTLKGREQEE
jgi:sodium/bile acid cotransporter 7